MALVTVTHTTRYRYRKPVGFGEHRMMFRPNESFDQRIVSNDLVIAPKPAELRYVQDVFGNTVGIARFGQARSDTLTFQSTVRLEHRAEPRVRDAGDLIDAGDRSLPMAYDADDMPDLLRSIERQHPDPDGVFERWVRRFVRRDGPTNILDLLSTMTRAIKADFSYAGRLEGGAQSPLETLHLGAGSCRDFAVLMMEAVRSLGLAARFVSGYIYSTKGGLRRQRGGHTHAWVRVYLPRCGWVEFDPTNGIVGSTDLIRVAVARDPRQASPLSGSWGGEAGEFIGMDVDVQVEVEIDALRQAG